MTWTKKHDEFCLEQKLRPSSIFLLRWLLRRAKQNQVSEIEIDLRVFNTWVGKRRGTPYDRKTIREAIAQIDECTQGLVLITKDYTPWVKKLLVRPLSDVRSENSSKSGVIPKLKVVNPMYSDEHKQAAIEQQQQDISRLSSFLVKLGLKYTQDAIVKLWRMAGKSVDEVKNGVELMLFQNSTQESKIRNPHDWLHDCLRYGWQKGLNLYYQAELPYFKSVEDIEVYVNRALPDKSPVYQT